FARCLGHLKFSVRILQGPKQRMASEDLAVVGQAESGWGGNRPVQARWHRHGGIATMRWNDRHGAEAGQRPAMLERLEQRCVVAAYVQDQQLCGVFTGVCLNRPEALRYERIYRHGL
ncbi:hypothetical protein RZS08_39250, partial [Arthrospira platensis SPKY1]|nr:hypothetical protein [Arthrospira platensis SPKY1]